MEKEVKKLRGLTVEINKGKVKLTLEDETHPWWREERNREKDSILCPEIAKKIIDIASNLTYENDKGEKLGKYNFEIINLPPNPKSSQGKMKTRYKNHIIDFLKERGKGLERFKDKEILLYVGIYLRPERYESYDIDNFLKAVIDSLKEFIGDDNKIISLLVDKYKIEDYPKEDLDFLEQVLIVVTDPKAKQDILKGGVILI